jgi:RNA polymerase sigma-70 factor (family 1)
MALYSNDTDDELVRKLRLSDQAAFTEVYERYWDTLLGMAFNRLKVLDAAEDIVHDVFAALWKNRDRAEIRSLRNWLATAVKYLIIRAAEKAARQAQYSREQGRLAGVEDQLSKDLADKELARLLAEEIDRLPEKCRIVFRLRQQGFSNPEIAAEMHTTVKTVENQVNRGVRALKVALKNAFFGFFPFL